MTCVQCIINCSAHYLTEVSQSDNYSQCYNSSQLGYLALHRSLIHSLTLKHFMNEKNQIFFFFFFPVLLVLWLCLISPFFTVKWVSSPSSLCQILSPGYHFFFFFRMSVVDVLLNQLQQVEPYEIADILLVFIYKNNGVIWFTLNILILKFNFSQMVPAFSVMRD